RLLRDARAEALVRRVEARRILSLCGAAGLRCRDRVAVLRVELGLVRLRLGRDALTVSRFCVLRAVLLSEGLAVVGRHELAVRHGLLGLAVLRCVRVRRLSLQGELMGGARHALAVGLALAMRTERAREVGQALSLEERLALGRSVPLICARRLDRRCGDGY